MYLIDSDVLITARKQYYSFDVVPGFWQWIIKAHEQGIVGSIRQVKDEITGGEDELKDWVKVLPANFFAEADNEVTSNIAELATWASSSRYFQDATDKFMGSTDLLLIAHAKAHGHTVVSLETSTPNSLSKIKIPDVCKHFEVACVRTFKMLAAENVQFHLRTSSI
jgi:hypothetical protein